MRSFPSKLISAVVAVLLLVGDFPATSALPSYGGRKSLWHVSDSRDDPIKTVLRESSSEGLNISSSKKIVSFRSLRGFLSPPPSPLKAQPRSFHMPSPSPPPQIIWIHLSDFCHVDFISKRKCMFKGASLTSQFHMMYMIKICAFNN
uniref:Uncharacterized protein n=1 Tax=Quercus lobata TaxID=97700 RepID=A0A7N2MMU5_QUELO